MRQAPAACAKRPDPLLVRPYFSSRYSLPTKSSISTAAVRLPSSSFPNDKGKTSPMCTERSCSGSLRRRPNATPSFKSHSRSHTSGRTRVDVSRGHHHRVRSGVRHRAAQNCDANTRRPISPPAPSSQAASSIMCALPCAAYATAGLLQQGYDQDLEHGRLARRGRHRRRRPGHGRGLRPVQHRRDAEPENVQAGDHRHGQERASGETGADGVKRIESLATTAATFFGDRLLSADKFAQLDLIFILLEFTFLFFQDLPMLNVLDTRQKRYYVLDDFYSFLDYGNLAP